MVQIGKVDLYSLILDKQTSLAFSHGFVIPVLVSTVEGNGLGMNPALIPRNILSPYHTS